MRHAGGFPISWRLSRARRRRCWRRWTDEDFFEAYTGKVVNLDVPDAEADEGADDEIPF